MSTQTYAYRENVRVPVKVPAQVVGEELERIRLANGGKLTAAAVVRAATPKESPLHDAIPYWNDKVAAHAYRVHFARQLIRSIRVVVEDVPQSTPAFVNVQIKGRHYYQSGEVLVRNVAEFESAVRESKLKLDMARRSFEDLKRLATGPMADDRLALIGIVVEALGTARSAVERLQ